jgi:NCS2 family nucleobase:cation symporter-2
MKRPENITYWVDEIPPAWVSVLQGLQHISVYAISLVFPVIILSTINSSKEEIMFVVSMSMIAGGLGVIYQSLKKGILGSGFLIPQICGPSFIPSSLLAVQIGGIPLMLGMTVFAGFLEMIFSRFIDKLKILFPPEVTGTIVTMVGISVVGLAVKNFVGIGGSDTVILPAELFVSVSTLTIMVIINVWTKGKLKMFSVLIGMVTGYLIAIYNGVISTQAITEIKNASFVWFPLSKHPGFSFSFKLVLPFGVAMLCSSLKSIGDMITAQKINDSAWKRPDMKNIGCGILADGAGCFTAGILGGMGQSTSSANLGLTIATGVTSRVVALMMGGMLIIGGFFPKISALFAVMPKPLMGSVLIFALSFMVVAGFQIITSRMMDARKTFVVGFSIIFGLSADLSPEIYQSVPHWLHPIVSSSLSLSAVIAVILNLLFRIGIKNKANITLLLSSDFDTTLQVMERLGKMWGAQHEVIFKAASALDELKNICLLLNSEEDSLEVAVKFDEFSLDLETVVKSKIEIDINSLPNNLATEIPSAKTLALFMLNKISDNLSFKYRGSTTTIHIHFNH